MSKNYQQKIEEAVRVTIQLAQELNRTPLKLELMRIIPRQTIDVHIGGYEKLLSMAGLNPHSAATSYQPMIKPSLEMYKKDLPDELENKIVLSPRIESSIQIAGDMHLPWVHEPTLKYFHEFNGDMKPNYVVQIGDLYDMYAHTRFPKSQNIYTPKDEEARARAKAVEFWELVKHNNPKARRIQFKGNHDIRPIKSALQHAPNLEHFVESYMDQLMAFDGVETIADHREIYQIEGIGFHHGYLAQLGAHRDSNLINMVVGHTHMGGAVYRGIRGQTLWELNAGLMGDPTSKVMSYTQAKEEKQTLGFGFIDKYGPRFIAT